MVLVQQYRKIQRSFNEIESLAAAVGRGLRLRLKADTAAPKLGIQVKVAVLWNECAVKLPPSHPSRSVVSKIAACVP